MNPSEPLAPELGPPTFDVLPLSPELRRAVDELGFKHPTPVQTAVFDSASRGLDLVVQARTGTGKTAAFGLPLLDRLVDGKNRATQALVLAPTRELALQITREFSGLSKHLPLKTLAVYGGAAMEPQVHALAEGAPVVVGTPGRVLDHLERGTLNASALKLVVLDESDEMLSMGFLPQINAILDKLPRPHQTLLFSATVPPDVKRIAESRLTNPEFITLSGDHIGALSIEHYTYPSRGHKAEELVQILRAENPDSAIIFCNTREQTKRIARALQNEGFPADWLNADLAQSDRERVMAETRALKLRFLVATDVAARGIDISHLTHVINVDLPESAEAYIHRTGRTGRAGKTGRALSLIAPQDVGNLYMLRLTYKIFPVERSLPTREELAARAEVVELERLQASLKHAKFTPGELSLARRVLFDADAETLVASLLRSRTQSAHDVAASPSLPSASEPSRREAPKAPSQRDSTSGRAENAPAPSSWIEQGDFAPREFRHKDEPKGDKGKKKRHSKNDAVRSDRAADRGSDLRHAPLEEGAEEARSKDGAPGTDDAARVFVSVGKRDGLERHGLAGALAARGVPEEHVLGIKLKDKHSFVLVKPDFVASIITALDGQPASLFGLSVEGAERKSRPLELREELGGDELTGRDLGNPGERIVRAERARPRDERPSKLRGPEITEASQAAESPKPWHADREMDDDLPKYTFSEN